VVSEFFFPIGGGGNPFPPTFGRAFCSYFIPEQWAKPWSLRMWTHKARQNNVEQFLAEESRNKRLVRPAKREMGRKASFYGLLLTILYGYGRD
jgi:hypothetical protein